MLGFEQFGVITGFQTSTVGYVSYILYQESHRLFQTTLIMFLFKFTFSIVAPERQVDTVARYERLQARRKNRPILGLNS